MNLILAIIILIFAFLSPNGEERNIFIIMSFILLCLHELNQIKEKLHQQYKANIMLFGMIKHLEGIIEKLPRGINNGQDINKIKK